MSNTLVRVLVAVVAIPVILWLIIAGGWWFTGFVVLLAVLGLKEYYAMAQARALRPQTAVGLTAAAVFPIVLYMLLTGGGTTAAFAVIAFFLLLTVVVLGVELWRALPDPLINTAVTLAGVGYVALCFGSLIGVRNLPAAPWVEMQTAAGTADEQGQWLVFLMFAAIWMCDSVAYFVGRAIGRHKIAPRVSPNKSWEGGIAGLVGAALAFAAGAAFALPSLPTVHAAVLGVLIGMVGQVGDFAESLLKRDAGVKDSSAIIPGHGGILDRFDSALFAAPVVFIYVSIVFLR